MMTTLFNDNNVFDGILTAQLTPSMVRKQQEFEAIKEEKNKTTDNLQHQISMILDQFPKEFKMHNTDRANYMTFWICDERYDNKIEEKTPDELMDQLRPLIQAYRKELNDYIEANDKLKSLKNEEYFSSVYYQKQPWELTSEQFIKAVTKGGFIYSPEYKPHSVEDIREIGVNYKKIKLNTISTKAGDIDLYKSEEIRETASGKKFTDPSLYAIHDGITIGYAAPAIFGGFELIVADEYQGMGIGTALLKLFWEINPYYRSGGFTMGGRSTALKVHRQMVEEAIQRGENVPQKVLREYGYL